MKRPMLISALSMDNDGESIAPLSSKRRRLNYGFNWKVGELPEMPYLYLREKTSVILLNDSPQKVADRIVSSAKAMNCIGEFDDSKVRLAILKLVLDGIPLNSVITNILFLFNKG